MAFRQYSGLSGSRPEKLLILGFESSTFTYISMLKKFGHFLMNSSRDTGGGASGAPPARGKDILIPHRRGLKYFTLCEFLIRCDVFCKGKKEHHYVRHM